MLPIMPYPTYCQLQHGKEAYEMVRENNRIGRERQKYYNIGTTLVSFQPGDMVYLKKMVNSRQKCAKFRIRWKGPY